MKESISVAGLQFAHEPDRKEANLNRARDMISANPGHDIYVLPELSSSGYDIKAFEKLDQLAEEEHGPSYLFFSTLAKEHRCFICYSFPRRLDSAKHAISAAVVDPEGQRVALYDKMHICQFGECREKDYFTEGSLPAGCFEVSGLKVGVSICYDIRFPEMTRHLVLEKDIVLLLHLGGWPRDAAFHTWHTFVITRAVENSIYIMSVNRAGSHNGCSIFCPPFIDDRIKPRTLGDEEGVLVGKVDTGYLEEIRSTYPFLKERRPDLY